MMQNWKFGTRPGGQVVTAYKLTSKSGISAVILDQGAILQSFYLANGHNIAFGFPTWEDYETDTHYTGRIIGPNANRIVGAEFQIGEDKFELAKNDGNSNLHSGPNGFDSQQWKATQSTSGLNLELQTPDGYSGFPGPIKANLNISLIRNILRLDMHVSSARPTPINLTWHPYWNLSGNGKIDDHNLCVEAKNHTRLGVQHPLPVKETLYDLRRSRPLGSVRLDTNYSHVKSAQLVCGKTVMTLTSSLPDMHIYTGDALPSARAGLALEPQYRPNDINLAKDSLLQPHENYAHWIEYCFDTL